MKQETINKIKELKKKGKSCKQVSDLLKLTYSKCFYYYNEDYQKKTIERAKKWTKENPEIKDKDKYRTYQKKYQNKYYHSPENHERMKEYHREYQRRRYNELKGGVQ